MLIIKRSNCIIQHLVSSHSVGGRTIKLVNCYDYLKCSCSCVNIPCADGNTQSQTMKARKGSELKLGTCQEDRDFQYQVMLSDIIIPAGCGEVTATVHNDIALLMSELLACKGKT